MDALHLAANRCLVLRELVYELGGLASTSLSLSELDALVDNMISKGIPSDPSENLLRWIHTHRKQTTCKISQLLGVDVAKVLVPDCYGIFFDKAAPECKLCLDRHQCKEKRMAAGRKGEPVEVPDSRINQVYPISKRMSTDDVRDLLKGKMGQIAKTMAAGHKVVLLIDPDNSQPKVLVSTYTPNLASEEAEQEGATMATKPIKPNTKKATAADEDEEEDEAPAPVKKGSAAAKAPVKSKAVEADEDEDEDEDEEEEAPAPKKATKSAPAKATKKAVEEDEDEDEEADDNDEEEDEPAPAKGKFKKVEKAEKPKKEKAPESKAVAEFTASLKTTLKEDAALYKFAKKLGASWNKKDDPRINRMMCVMACKKIIAEK